MTQQFPKYDMHAHWYI